MAPIKFKCTGNQVCEQLCAPNTEEITGTCDGWVCCAPVNARELLAEKSPQVSAPEIPFELAIAVALAALLAIVGSRGK